MPNLIIMRYCNEQWYSCSLIWNHTQFLASVQLDLLKVSTLSFIFITFPLTILPVSFILVCIRSKFIILIKTIFFLVSTWRIVYSKLQNIITTISEWYFHNYSLCTYVHLQLDVHVYSNLTLLSTIMGVIIRHIWFRSLIVTKITSRMRYRRGTRRVPGG